MWCFDLKRFKLSILSVDDDADDGEESEGSVNAERSHKSKGEAVLKDIQGNCYVEVMKGEH